MKSNDQKEGWLALRGGVAILIMVFLAPVVYSLPIKIRLVGAVVYNSLWIILVVYLGYYTIKMVREDYREFVKTSSI